MSGSYVQIWLRISGKLEICFLLAYLIINTGKTPCISKPAKDV